MATAPKVPKGRKVRLEVALTYGSAKTVTEVTNANPGVASSTAHGMTAGAVGYFGEATGMPELEDKAAVSVATVTTDAFTLEEYNTTDFGNFTAGTFLPVATWGTLSEATSYAITGGEQKQVDSTTLLDTQDQEDAAGVSAERVNVSAYSNPRATTLAFIEACARASTAAIFRVTLADGTRRVWRGVPSLPGESLEKGQLAQGGFSTSVLGRTFRLPVAA